MAILFCGFTKGEQIPKMRNTKFETDRLKNQGDFHRTHVDFLFTFVILFYILLKVFNGFSSTFHLS